MARLSEDARKQLVKLLEACESFRSPDLWAPIVERLPEAVRVRIARLQAPRPFVTALVDTCANRDGGIESLQQVLHDVEGSDSFAVKAVDAFLAEQRSASPSSPSPPLASPPLASPPLASPPPASSPPRLVREVRVPDAAGYELTIALAPRGADLETSYYLRDGTAIGRVLRSASELSPLIAQAANALDSGMATDADIGGRTEASASADANARPATSAAALLDERTRARAGEALFALLFGSQSQWGPVLNTLFRTPDPNLQRTPSFAPVMTRVATADPALVRLPWRLTRYPSAELGRGIELVRDCGWTFATAPADRARHGYTTPAPATVVVIAPPGDDAALASLREILAEVWPSRRSAGHNIERLAPSADLGAALPALRPDIIYVHPSEYSPSDALIAGLAAARHRPQVLYLGLACPEPPATLLAAGIPLIVWRPLARTHPDAADLAERWLKAWLGASADPVSALHDTVRALPATSREAATVAVHADYAHWRTAGLFEQAAIASPLHKVDREEAKAVTTKRIKELARSDKQRVLGLLAYAAPGNHLTELCEQLELELMLEAEREAAIAWIQLELPRPYGDEPADFEQDLRLQLGAAGGEPLGHALRRRAPRATRARPILWLDWGTFGRAAQGGPLSEAELHDWAALGSEVLATECPDGLRIVSYIAVETAEDALMDEIIAELFDQHTTAGFGLTSLRLDKVTEQHLLDYLREHGGCPQNLERDVARLIMRTTGGAFDGTLALIDEARASSWSRLRDRLQAKQGKPTRPRGRGRTL